MAQVSIDDRRYNAIRTVTVVGAGVNLLLSVFKIVLGTIGQSHALIADGVHSLSDLATDGLVLYGARHGSKDADADHPYGHARIETASTVALGLFLILIASGIILDAGQRLLDIQRLLHPGWLALLTALFAIASKEWLYHYTLRVAKRERSNLLRANAWHHRSDAASSVVVLVGVAGAMLGLDYLDAFASVIVAVMIARIGGHLSWQALQELVDTGLEQERVVAIRNTILQVDGARDAHMLRTRRMGGDAFVDVHVQVNPWLSVSEGHQIGEYVRRQVVDEIPEVTDITVHIDPEDDEDAALCPELPLRREILEKLHARWRPLLDTSRIQRVDLHYLGGKIHVELLLPLTLVDNYEQAIQLAEQLCRAGRSLQEVGPIQVYFG